MRPDANRISLQSIRQILDAAQPLDLDIAGTAVKSALRRGSPQACETAYLGLFDGEDLRTNAMAAEVKAMLVAARQRGANVEMRALSVNQPFAELIAQGEKKIECRTWRRDHGGDLPIVR